MEPILLAGAAVSAVFVWAALAGYVARIDRRRTVARRVVSAALSTLRSDDMATLAGRVVRVQTLLARVSRDMVLHTAADAGTPPEAAGVLTAYLIDRWGIDTIVREASFHRRSRDTWRRTASLTILFNLDHAQAIDLLSLAVDGPSADVASVAITLLGLSPHPRAVSILIDALKRHRHLAPRIVVHLDQSPQRPVHACRELLHDVDPDIRFWGATLLARYPEMTWLEAELATLVDDAEPRVRRAAIQSLGKIGDRIAATSALRLLRDPVSYVRAHAARALGELDRTGDAAAVAALLGDPDWWVRAAAKRSLEMMGSEVWTVLMPCLDDPDPFVRNGAAEVFQNLGILDHLIILEAASDGPSLAKVDLLRRIAFAGGERLTDSLIERAGPAAAPGVRRLLSTLEQVGVA